MPATLVREAEMPKYLVISSLTQERRD